MSPGRGIPSERTVQVQRGALLGVLSALIYGVARFGDAENFVRSIDRSPRLFFDFIHYYYASAESLVAGQNPVAGYLYSPLLAIALIPLTWLGPELATAAWALVQALAIALLVLRTAALGPPGKLGGFLAAWLTLLSTATLHSLKWGQVGLVLGALILEGAIRLSRRRDLATSLLWGSAIAVKFYPAILWPLALVLGRLRASFGVVAVSAALLSLPSLVVLGERRTLRFYRRLFRALSETSASALGDPSSQAVAAWIRREWNVEAALAVALVGIVLVLFTLLLLRGGENDGPKQREGGPDERALLGGLVLAALVPFFVLTCWPLYFCTLPALTLLTAERWRRSGPSILRVPALAVLVVAGLAQTFPAVDVAGGWIHYADRGWLLEANLAVTVCALASLAPRSAGAREEAQSLKRSISATSF